MVRLVLMIIGLPSSMRELNRLYTQDIENGVTNSVPRSSSISRSHLSSELKVSSCLS